jgi:DNA replication protein DnaC
VNPASPRLLRYQSPEPVCWPPRHAIGDEVTYIPFDPQAANLMFTLVSRRYERASLIVTSNKPFSAWGEILGDEVTAAAMIDRLVHPPRSSRSKATATEPQESP